MDLNVTLITGAASGIGAAAATKLAALGHKLVLIDIAAEAIAAHTKTLEAPGTHLALAMDVSDEGGWDEAERAIKARFGGLSGLVVNAGISNSGSITEMAFERWRNVLRVNLDGGLLTLRSGLRLMRDGGAAVVVSSMSARKAEPGTGAYGASKAALAQLARVAAKESAPRQIRVNTIMPGGVETPIWRSMDFFKDIVAETGSEDAAFAAMAQMATPLKRYAKPDEIAAMIAYLLGPDAISITGAEIVIDGGYSL